MSDLIHIKQLVLPTVVGVPDEERELPQSVSVNATLTLESSIKGIDDDLAKTVDYYEVTMEMRKVASAGDRKLIETLAEDLCSAILKFKGVAKVNLEVLKFVLPNCGSVSVEIVREK